MEPPTHIQRTQDLNYYGLLIQPYDWPYEDNNNVIRPYVLDVVLCDIQYLYITYHDYYHMINAIINFPTTGMYIPSQQLTYSAKMVPAAKILVPGSWNIYIYVTAFAKRRLPHTFNFEILAIYNLLYNNIGKIITLKCSEHQHRLMDGENFRLVSFLITKFWCSKWMCHIIYIHI